MRKFVLLALLAGVASWIYFEDDGKGTAVTSAGNSSSSAVQNTSTLAARNECLTGKPGTGVILAVASDYELRSAPGEESERIKNIKASESLGRTHYHRVDTSTSVRHLCVDGDWAQVQIASPEWLTHVVGWVPNTVLRQIERTASGTHVYVESDFFWDSDTIQYKPEIVAVVNKIAEEHDGCSRLDTGTVALSSSRSKPNDPVFFITCGTGSRLFNVWFRPSDADKTFKAPPAITRGDAIVACENAAKSSATHPSTVDFSRIMDVAFWAREDGRASLESTFTAKNSFNLELKYKIRCLFDSNTLIEANVVEAG